MFPLVICFILGLREAHWSATQPSSRPNTDAPENRVELIFVSADAVFDPGTSEMTVMITVKMRATNGPVVAQPFYAGWYRVEVTAPLKKMPVVRSMRPGRESPAMRELT